MVKCMFLSAVILIAPVVPISAGAADFEHIYNEHVEPE